jgi:hypothetical protein
MLGSGSGERMRQWTFWEWVAYASLGIAAAVIALDTSLKLTTGSLRQEVSGLLESPIWGFTPLFFFLVGTATFVLREMGWLDRSRRPIAASDRHHGPAPKSLAPSIEICFEKRAPYEVSDVQHHHVLSTVRIGLRNSGGGALSNCKVYVDKISPEPSIPGGLPVLLEDAGFTLRHDDPEKLVDIASHWDHVDKYRFSAPIGGGFAEAVWYIDDQPQRTIVIKVVASECQRSATFKISTDESKALHLEYIGYVN